jgi:hypothetical protein
LAWTSRSDQLRQVLAPPAVEDMYTLPKHMHPCGKYLVTDVGKEAISEWHPHAQMDLQQKQFLLVVAHRQVKRAVLTDCSNLSCFPLSCIF